MIKKQERYPKINSNPNFSELEEIILKFWHKDKTFQKSVNANTNANPNINKKEFVFYDGPPFANGLPHYGHLLTGFIKDTFGRYQTMLNKNVKRRFGWDCHGLPAEMGAEKDLGISGKIEIEKYGIDKFNDYCRKSVLKYTKEWEQYVLRQARWVDFENDYKTMNIDYMESVLWAFKQLYDKGFIYQSMRVMPYSWKCETPVSDFETRIDNAFREKKSKAVTVGFRLKNRDIIKQKILKNTLNNRNIEIKEVQVLAWTTTPWTLPSNLALAINKDMRYSCILYNEVCYIIASDLINKYKNEIVVDDKKSNVLCEVLGSDLIGLDYIPIFDYYAKHKNAFTILHGDFVTSEDGTGIVHMSPGFGEDDYNLCKANDIEVVCPVDNGGKFVFPVKDYIGIQVFETNDDIIIRLKQQGLWLKTEQYLHNYPHCWRTDTPLIYKAVSSWYLKVTDPRIKDQMIKHNQKINWIPDHIKNGLFGKWLENARDWSISRNRYWGCPIPIWISDDPKYPNIEVYGSIAELESAFNIKIDDLHRPFIDTLMRPNSKDPTGKSMMVRVPEVLDCWFESGSMPYAQVHYPFENKEWFENNSPADFIVEYLAQTRGWFYTMIVLSTALFDKPPFLNCICHGVILGNDRQKLSKRLKNYADPNIVFQQYGADAMRWFMLSSPVMRGQELIIDTEASGIKEVLRTIIKPIWNAYNFFSIYANADDIKAEFSLNSTNLLDKYIIAKCIHVTNVVKIMLDKYDTVTATNLIETFVEILNNWYIRRSRERFWRGDKDQDKIYAYNTLYSVLDILCKIIAPMMPLIAESIYSGLHKYDNYDNLQNTNTSKNAHASVHLQEYPLLEVREEDANIIDNMERVRDACNAALYIRNENNIRIRQPLLEAIFVGVTKNDLSEELKQLVLDEINVKQWVNLDKINIEKYANYKLQLNLPALGQRLPNKIKDMISAVKAENWKIISDDDGKYSNKVKIGKGGDIENTSLNEILLENEFVLKLESKKEYANVATTLSTNDAMVILNLDITENLWQEGVARDVVRTIQQVRKDFGLNILDRIIVYVSSDDEKITAAITLWEKYIKEQTLCNKLHINVDNNNNNDIANHAVNIAAVSKAKLNIDNQDISISIYAL